MKLKSNCCGVEDRMINPLVSYNEVGVCPDCKEQCEFEEYEPELDISHDNWRAPNNTDYMLELKKYKVAIG